MAVSNGVAGGAAVSSASITILLRAQPNSHPFEERHCVLDGKMTKVGRSVAKAKPNPGNLIFDCKVLSRNHAVMWSADGQVFVRDTKSSNGTFINKKRLSSTGEESADTPVKDGDVIQFGVDVMESQRQKVTHGCVIALFVNPSARAVSPPPETVPGVRLSDVTELAQLLMDARHRQEVIENKLGSVQFDMEQTASAWERECKTFMDEDQLLARIETLENQLQFYTQDQGANEIQKTLRQLEEDKNGCTARAKESLQNMLQEKMEVLKKYSNLQLDYDQSEQECDRWKTLYEEAQEDRKRLAEALDGREHEGRKQLAELQNLRQQQSALEKEHVPMKLQHQETLVKLDQASLDLAGVSEQNHFMSDRLASLQQQMELLHDRNVDLQELNDAAAEQVRLRESEITELRAELKERETERDRVEALDAHHSAAGHPSAALTATAALSNNPYDRFMAVTQSQADARNQGNASNHVADLYASELELHDASSTEANSSQAADGLYENASHSASTALANSTSSAEVPVSAIVASAVASGLFAIAYSFASLNGAL